MIEGVRVVERGGLRLCEDCYTAQGHGDFEQVYAWAGELGVCEVCGAGRPSPGPSSTPMLDAERAYLPWFHRDSTRWQGPRYRR